MNESASDSTRANIRIDMFRYLQTRKHALLALLVCALGVVGIVRMTCGSEPGATRPGTALVVCASEIKRTIEELCMLSERAYGTRASIRRECTILHVTHSAAEAERLAEVRLDSADLLHP